MDFPLRKFSIDSDFGTVKELPDIFYNNQSRFKFGMIYANFIFTRKFASGADAIAHVKKSSSEVTNFPDREASRIVSIVFGSLFTVRDAMRFEEYEIVIKRPYKDKNAMKV